MEDMKPDRTVAEVIAKDLAALGARRCFGLLGTANFRVSLALAEAGVELVSARHEGNAAAMADCASIAICCRPGRAASARSTSCGSWSLRIDFAP